jgi:signal peptidase II
MRKPLLFFTIVLAGIGLDLLTKKLAFDKLPWPQTYVLIPNVLEFVHAENHGVAFSLLAQHPAIILSFTSVAIVLLALFYARVRRRAQALVLAALALLLIGATGNLIDRLAFDFVRDFIYFVPELPVIGHWAVFNVADICITVGVILFLVSELFFSKRPEENKAVA